MSPTPLCSLLSCLQIWSSRIFWPSPSIFAVGRKWQNSAVTQDKQKTPHKQSCSGYVFPYPLLCSLWCSPLFCRNILWGNALRNKIFGKNKWSLERFVKNFFLARGNAQGVSVTYWSKGWMGREFCNVCMYNSKFLQPSCWCEENFKYHHLLFLLTCANFHQSGSS